MSNPAADRFAIRTPVESTGNLPLLPNPRHDRPIA